jgi:urate oxidase
MNFSVKTLGMSVVIALVIGFLAGFIPQRSNMVTATNEKNQAQVQLGRAQEEATINGFRNRLAVVYVEAEKKNFAQASSDASGLFTAMQSYSDQTPDSGVRQQLSTFLSMRDAVISGLAKGDAAVTAQLQDLFVKMQSVAASSNTGV